MLSNTSPQCPNELLSFNTALAAPFKPGSVPATLDALFETESSSGPAATPEGLREAVYEIFHAIGNLLNEELDAAQACLQRAASVLRLAPCTSGLSGTVPQNARHLSRGGLAPWQARVLQAHIEAHLDAAIRTTELAKLVQLSSFHFCRVFRVSFGNSPHGYVTRRRIERAQGLMLTTKLPLGQIAVGCGFADQAHFTKLFRKFTGESPGEWRRVRADPSAHLNHKSA
jgi:AraC family transcriptional regulator